MKKVFLLLFALLTVAVASAQMRTISGQVVYAGDGEPLAGATVLPVGGNGIGTATDIDGNFSLRVPNSVSKITVSYVGMITQEVAVTDTPMLIKLTNSDNKLDEVMVVAYGTSKKSAYTGAASVVDASVIEDRLVSNLSNALSGVVAGVQTLNSNGQPGTSSTVRIRGVGSINASMNPLYVLDGIPYDGDLASINTADIESMTVLKDAAAAALYGARGANGVILVTTKRGKAGAAKVTLDARWGTNSRQITNYDVIESPEQYLELTYAAQRNAALYHMGYTPERAHAYGNSQLFASTGYNVFTAPEGESLINPDGRFNPNAKRGYSDGTYFYTPDNWGDVTFRNGLRQEYNVSVSSATDRLNYYVSASFLDDQGVIDNSAFKRLSTRASVEYQMKNWLKIGTNIAYSYSDSQYPDEQTATASSGNAFFIANSMAPIYPIYVRDAKGQIMYNETFGHPIFDYGDSKSTNYSRAFMSQANPASQLLYDTSKYLVDLLNGKWYVQLTPIEGLTVTGTVGLTIDNTRLHEVSNPLYGQFATDGGQTTQEQMRTKGLNLQGLANYNRTFWDHHTFDFLLGYESYEWNYEYVYAYGKNLYNPMNWTVGNTLNNNQRSGSGGYYDYATRGIFGRINYDYDSRYFGSFSYRRDASSRFHPDHRWGNFFSVSAAWDVAQETFMHDTSTWLDQLKLRASFGQQGNDALGSSQYYYYAYVDQYQITGSESWSDGTLAFKGNPEITWEKSNSFNVGVDFSFWKGKLSGMVEYFNRQTSDMLFNRAVAPSLGYSSIPVNLGSMRNNGFEIELTYRPIVTRNIQWDITGNATFINNKILELPEEYEGKWISGSRIYEEGESMYRMYLVKYAGVDPATGKAQYWAYKKDDKGNRIPGSDYVTDTYSTDYRYATDNLLPAVYGGFGTTLKVYGFDFGISCAYQLGGKIYDQGYQYFMGSGASSEYGHNWHKDILKAWTPENPNTDVPRLDAQESRSFYSNLSDRGLISSNYFAINNITLGYTLPTSLTSKIGIESIRIYGAADNVALWSARKGLDPRQSYTSSTTSTYTALRCISGGLKVVF